MRWLLGGSALVIGCLTLLLTGWDISQLFGPTYEPTTIFSWVGHGPIQILWGMFTLIAALLIWFGIRIIRAGE